MPACSSPVHRCLQLCMYLLRSHCLSVCVCVCSLLVTVSSWHSASLLVLAIIMSSHHREDRQLCLVVGLSLVHSSNVHFKSQVFCLFVCLSKSLFLPLCLCCDLCICFWPFLSLSLCVLYMLTYLHDVSSLPPVCHFSFSVFLSLSILLLLSPSLSLSTFRNCCL